MEANPIQFAVVREDPLVEKAVLARHPSKQMLIIASGGCTALALKAWHPDLHITLLDPNPAALGIIRDKITALDTGVPLSRFNVEDSSPDGLSQCGNFESLFRTFRRFIEELVLDRDALRQMFTEPDSFEDRRDELLASPYWPIAFELVFSEPFLRTMFGDDALQYAPRGSYPAYFQERFEIGLRQPDGQNNPFLHHIFLGQYLSEALPEFLNQRPEKLDFTWINGPLDKVHFRDFDFIGLSNILDWTPPMEAQKILARIKEESQAGTTVIWRQLNNQRPLPNQLKPDFVFDPLWEKQLHQADRSLFYSSIHVGYRAQ